MFIQAMKHQQYMSSIEDQAWSTVKASAENLSRGVTEKESSKDRILLTMKVPRPIRSRARKSRQRKFQGTKVPVKVPGSELARILLEL